VGIKSFVFFKKRKPFLKKGPSPGGLSANVKLNPLKSCPYSGAAIPVWPILNREDSHTAMVVEHYK
jgi:hypothetical protein